MTLARQPRRKSGWRRSSYCAGRCMDIYRDFSDLPASFNKNGVEYLIVGGCALAFHGAPRYTGDLSVRGPRLAAACFAQSVPTDVSAPPSLQAQDERPLRIADGHDGQPVAAAHQR